jgi:hypothetical protein
VSGAVVLAARLARRGVIAVPTQDETVRAWLSGTRRDVLTVREVFTGADEVWAWARGGRSGTHPVADPDGAADAVKEFLRAEEP